MRRRTVQPENRSFVSRCFDSLSYHLTEATKNANCFEECNVFGNGKSELSAIQEGSPRKRCTFLARKGAKPFANTKVHFFFARKVQNSSPFSAQLR